MDKARPSRIASEFPCSDCSIVHDQRDPAAGCPGPGQSRLDILHRRRNGAIVLAQCGHRRSALGLLVFLFFRELLFRQLLCVGWEKRRQGVEASEGTRDGNETGRISKLVNSENNAATLGSGSKHTEFGGRRLCGQRRRRKIALTRETILTIQTPSHRNEAIQRGQER